MRFISKLLVTALVVFLGIALGNLLVDFVALPEWLAGPLPVAVGIGLGFCVHDLKFWKTENGK